MIYEGQSLRHELKYYISRGEYLALRSRLRAVMTPDSHMKDEEGYLVTSVYLDDVTGSAWREKNAGVRFRKKYRIRLYDRSDQRIQLECKRKYGDLTGKTTAPLTREEYDRLLEENFDVLFDRSEPICSAVLALNRTRLLKPQVAVEYRREAYTAPAGNVRVTFDKEISGSVRTVDVFDPRYGAFRVLPPDTVVLEIKFDDFLPDYILQMLRPVMGNRSAISKYVLCRDAQRKADTI